MDCQEFPVSTRIFVCNWTREAQWKYSSNDHRKRYWKNFRNTYPWLNTDLPLYNLRTIRKDHKMNQAESYKLVTEIEAGKWKYQ